MRLVNEEGVEWKVEIEYARSMVIIKEGWTAFRKDNKIANSETCRFKLIGGPIANVLPVQKIPTPLCLQKIRYNFFDCILAILVCLIKMLLVLNLLGHQISDSFFA